MSRPNPSATWYYLSHPVYPRPPTLEPPTLEPPTLKYSSLKPPSPSPKGRGFGWALKQMKKGRTVARPAWDKGTGYFTSCPEPGVSKLMVLYGKKSVYERGTVTTVDVLARDWILWGEENA